MKRTTNSGWLTYERRLKSMKRAPEKIRALVSRETVLVSLRFTFRFNAARSKLIDVRRVLAFVGFPLCAAASAPLHRHSPVSVKAAQKKATRVPSLGS